MTAQLPLWPVDHEHRWHRITFGDYSWRQCFACGASTWQRTMTEQERAVLDAVRAERAIELGSRGKPWDDDAIWPVYLRAVEHRRKAVDAWLKAEPVIEAETIGMALA